MKHTMKWVGLLGLLLYTAVGHAQQTPPPETPPVEVPAAVEPATGDASAEVAASEAAAEETAAGQEQSEETTPSPSEIEALKAELERLRREAEEARRQQEERIRALEQRLQELQRPAPPPTAPPTPAPNPVTTRPGFQARLYGFARADVDVDSSRMFAGPHLPFWVLSPDDPRAASRDDGSFTVHGRLTRLGLDTVAPPIPRLGDARFTGKIEVDFFNILPDRNSATTNSRALLRMRHAYGRLDWQRSHFLFGQYWDLISPLFPAANFDVVMWYAGNLADRRPQLRYVWEPPLGRGKGSLGFMVGSPGAVDSQDLDADQVFDGEESSRPTLQTRLAVNQPSWVQGQTWEVGLWGHSGKFRIDRDRAISGRRSFSSSAVGLDARVPISRKLLLQGELWTGKALSDVRGGVGQNVNTLTGEEVHADGAWAELFYQWSDVYGLGAGFTIDNPDDDDVVPFTGANQTAVGRTLNRSYYVVNRYSPGGGMVIGLDWMLFRTKFRGLSSGSNNRWNLWLQQNF